MTLPSPDSKSKEFNIYKTLKKIFHSPEIGNLAAKNIYDTYITLYPQSEHKQSLKYKYLWHRKIRGYRYKKVVNAPIGEEIISQRLSSLSQNSKKDKEILLVSHELTLTGAPRALLNLAIALKQNGYDPYIFSLKTGPLAEECLRWEIPVICHPEQMYVINLFGDSVDNTIFKFFSSFKTILFNTTVTMKLLQLSCFTDDSIKLAWIHESAQLYDDWTINEFSSAINKLKGVYIVGEHARKNALQFFSRATEFKNLYYCIQGIDSNLKPTNKFNDGKLHLLIAGTIEKRKGHHILGQALDLLSKDERNKIQIHCAGSLVHSNVKDTLDKYSPETVTFEGNMNHDDLIALLNKCDALLCPSLDDPMPIVCTEAFQHKIPVVVSDHTGTASFIENCKNGFVVEANSPKSLAQALRHIINNKETLPEIGRRGESIYLNNFTEDVFKQNVLDIFSSYIS